jgi:antitoxin VapB
MTFGIKYRSCGHILDMISDALDSDKTLEIIYRIVYTIYIYYMEVLMKTAKLFQNGQSQAVRLPKEFRFEDDYVFVKKSGNVVVLIPSRNSWDTLVHSLGKFSDDFMTERKQPKLQKREKF